MLAALGATAMLSAGCVDLVVEYYTPLTNPALAGDGGLEGGGGSGGGAGAGDDAGDGGGDGRDG
jgi:hypothetical protein